MSFTRLFWEVSCIQAAPIDYQHSPPLFQPRFRVCVIILPISRTWSPFRLVKILPPMRSRASNTTTSQPWRCRTAAACRPETPAPTTITFLRSDLTACVPSTNSLGVLSSAARSEQQLLGFMGLMPVMREERWKDWAMLSWQVDIRWSYWVSKDHVETKLRGVGLCYRGG